VAKGLPKEVSDSNKPKYANRYKDSNDEHTTRDENGGLKFVYPYGATLEVRKPSFPILSTGPISFPPNRPIGAFYVSPKRGKLFVLGSIRFMEDEFFEKDDN
jgi:intraflagellar transport protein 52